MVTYIIGLSVVYASEHWSLTTRACLWVVTACMQLEGSVTSSERRLKRQMAEIDQLKVIQRQHLAVNAVSIVP